MNSCTHDFESVRTNARYVSALGDASLRSDHSALELSLIVPWAGLRRMIPGGIMDHPMYAALCDEVLPEMDVVDVDPFEAISRTIQVFHRIADQVRHVGRPVSARSAHEWLAHWLAAARTAHSRGDARRIRQALARIGGDEYTPMLLESSGAVRPRIDEEWFAKELGRLQTAHTLATCGPRLRVLTKKSQRYELGRTGDLQSGDPRGAAFTVWRCWRPTVLLWDAVTKPPMRSRRIGDRLSPKPKASPTLLLADSCVMSRVAARTYPNFSLTNCSRWRRMSTAAAQVRAKLPIRLRCWDAASLAHALCGISCSCRWRSCTSIFHLCSSCLHPEGRRVLAQTGTRRKHSSSEH